MVVVLIVEVGTVMMKEDMENVALKAEVVAVVMWNWACVKAVVVLAAVLLVDEEVKVEVLLK